MERGASLDSFYVADRQRGAAIAYQSADAGKPSGLAEACSSVRVGGVRYVDSDVLSLYQLAPAHAMDESHRHVFGSNFLSGLFVSFGDIVRAGAACAAAQ